jgi:hypothetical protein
VIGRIRGANESVRTLLDGVRKFLEVLGDLAEIFEKLVDIFRVDVKRLVHARGNVSESCQRFAKIDDGRANVGAIIS